MNKEFLEKLADDFGGKLVYDDNKPLEKEESPMEEEITISEFEVELDENGQFPLDQEVDVNVTVNVKDIDEEEAKKILHGEAEMLSGGDEEAESELFDKFMESFITNNAASVSFTAMRTEEGKIISNYKENEG